MCPRCEQEEENGNDRREEEHIGTAVNDGVLEKLQQFCYLGDMLDCEAGVERSARARVVAAWGRWWKVSSLVENHSIDLKTRGMVYEACVRSALLYRTETWALTDRLMDALQRCDCKMSR